MANPKLTFQIAHAIRGRIRVRIPALKRSKELFFCQKEYLSKFEGILKVNTSHLCGSVTICYDTELLIQEDILKIINNTRMEDLYPMEPQIQNGAKAVCSKTKARLKWSAIAVTLTILFSDTLFPLRILLYILIILISIPIYQQAIDTLFKEKRVDLDALNAFAMTIGLMADDLVVTAIMALLIYLGDYINALIASGKSKTLCMLMGKDDDVDIPDNNHRLIRTLTGVSTLIAGIILLPLPGPGVVVIPIGLGMLAKEYAWAGKLDLWFKEKTNTA